MGSRSSKVADSKERLSPVPFLPPPCPVTESRDTAIDCEDCRGALDGIQERIFELVMWKNAAKSTLWFGLGTMFFLSPCFSDDFSFRRRHHSSCPGHSLNGQRCLCKDSRDLLWRSIEDSANCTYSPIWDHVWPLDNPKEVFFVSFTLPKLYSCYSHQIHSKVESSLYCIQEAWKSCPRKKLIAISTVTLFWNLFSIRSRIFAGTRTDL